MQNYEHLVKRNEKMNVSKCKTVIFEKNIEKTLQ